MVEANPGLLAEGMFDLQTGVAPLHMAAKAGQLGAMQQLLDLGAGLDWRDGAGLTALQVGYGCDLCWRGGVWHVRLTRCGLAACYGL